MQATGIAESPSAIWATSPLRSLGTVAAVTAARRCRTTSPLLWLATREAGFGIDIIQLIFMIGRRRVCKWFRMLSLLHGLLFVSSLLSEDYVADLAQRIKLYSRFGYHVVNLDKTRQSRQ